MPAGLFMVTLDASSNPRRLPVIHLDPYTHLRLHDAETDRRSVDGLLVREARLARDRAAASPAPQPDPAGAHPVWTFMRRVSMIARP